jgi:hypothetical protein
VVLTGVVVFQAWSDPAASTQTAAQQTGATAPAAGSAFSSRSAGPSSATAGAGGSVPAPTTFSAAVPDLTNRDADGSAAASVTSGALPAGADFVSTGTGSWHVVPGTTPARGAGPDAKTYTVEVEDGVQSAEDDQAFADAVDATLGDPRSWIGGGQVNLARVDSGDPDFRISLTSQMTIRSPDLRGWDIPLEASCFNGWMGRVLINNARWTRGAMSYGTDLNGYRTYAVNHEVGHALGMRHEPCPAAGAAAPVMMQQSWSVSNDELSVLDPQTIPHDGSTCVANPYPFPGAAPVDPAGSPQTAAG